MNEQRTLFGLLRIVVAHVYQGFDHVVEGVYVVVVNHEVTHIGGFFEQ
jgi:hypothetical protein